MRKIAVGMIRAGARLLGVDLSMLTDRQVSRGVRAMSSITHEERRDAEVLHLRQYLFGVYWADDL